MFLQACQFNLSEDIQTLERSIESKGSNVVRLDNVMDIPVDDNELVGGRSALANPGTLKLLTDKRYLSFLEILSQEIDKYPNDILTTDLDNIFIGGQILGTNEQYFSGFYQPNSQSELLPRNGVLDHTMFYEGINTSENLTNTYSNYN